MFLLVNETSLFRLVSCDKFITLLLKSAYMRTRLSTGNVFQKMSNRVLEFLKQGVSPTKLALALAIGVTLGILPLLGVTTLICTLLAFRLKLNMAFIQLVNYIVYPIQLLLYIPFFKIGAGLFSNETFDYSLGDITTMLAADAIGTITKFFFINLYGVLLWLCIAPVLFAISYFVGRTIFKTMSKQFLKNEDMV
jgi:uncharacterized protein (DUF2062 family)